MIALIDYGAGNLRSVYKAFIAAGGDVRVTDSSKTILSAQKIVLPGVGAFQQGMQGLDQRGLLPILKKIADIQTPLLGICLGMQLMFNASTEQGHTSGLSFINGNVARFSSDHLSIPHTGWNQIEILKPSPLFTGVENQSFVYFNHSFFCDPIEKNQTLSQTEYGIYFASAVQNGNLYGLQFHPEKSQKIGIKILKNFVERC